MQRRLFIAINLPDRLKKDLLSLKEDWPSLPCHWVGQSNLHLTLVFLGYIRDEKIPDILKAVEQTTKNHGSFSISFNKICYGPDERKFPPRLVWIRGPKSQELIDIKKDIEDLLEGRVPFIREERDFIPHITLARIDAWRFKRLDPYDRPKIDSDISFDLEVESVEIMESHLKNTGVEYEILGSYPLNQK